MTSGGPDNYVTIFVRVVRDSSVKLEGGNYVLTVRQEVLCHNTVQWEILALISVISMIIS